MSSLLTLLESYQNIINDRIDNYLPIQSKLPPVIHDAMRYSALNGGKRIRPILMLETCRMLTGEYYQAIPSAIAIELAHCFTLVHDDLPSIDNDDLRRGKATNHKIYGEAMALLAGDALVIEAFRIISQHQKPLDITPKVILELSNSLSSNGVIGGQVADILAEREALAHDIASLEFIHTNKTARLIQAAITIGAIIANASYDDLTKLSKAGLYLGLAFQIKDDILDIEGNVADLGKNIGRDQELGKLTYPKLIGIDESKKKLDKLRIKAFKQIEDYQNAENLKLIFNFLINRNH